MSSSSNLSMRASCDRCRFHKLKCITYSQHNGLGASNRCARCVRAKTKCVFSRRAQKKRRSSPTLESCCRSITSGSPSESLEGLHVPDLSRMVPADDAWTVSRTSVYELFPEELASLLAQDDVGDPSMHMPVATTDTFLKKPQPEPLFIDSGMSEKRSSSSSLLPSSPGPGSLDGSLSVSVMLLSNLVADIHKTMALLSAHYPSTDIGGYPIGIVLHLAGNLVDIVSPVTTATNDASSSTSPAPPWEFVNTPPEVTSCEAEATLGTSGDIDSGSDMLSFLDTRFCSDFATAHSLPLMDTSTRLLAMSCYISLRRLYCLVFAHFEGYLCLQLMQGPSSRGRLTSHQAVERDLQIGALPPADTLCSCTHSAVKLLLEALQRAEDALSLPSTVDAARMCTPPTANTAEQPKSPGEVPLGFRLLAEEEAIPRTTREETQAHERNDKLAFMIQSVRRMLRERMDL